MIVINTILVEKINERLKQEFLIERCRVVNRVRAFYFAKNVLPLLFP